MISDELWHNMVEGRREREREKNPKTETMQKQTIIFFVVRLSETKLSYTHRTNNSNNTTKNAYSCVI